MAVFQVPVRDYHWTDKRTVVQSPLLDLGKATSTVIIQPLEGTNCHEPRILDSVSELEDIQREEYHADAHGVFSPEANSHRHPVWVPVNSVFKVGNNKLGSEVDVVNLKTLETSRELITRICWVPSLEARDGSGRFVTVVGMKRVIHRKHMSSVLFQRVGFPSQTTFKLVETASLSEFAPIDEHRKASLFQKQWDALQELSDGPSPNMPLSDCVSRLVASPWKMQPSRKPASNKQDATWPSWTDFSGHDIEVPGLGFCPKPPLRKAKDRRRTSGRGRARRPMRNESCKCTYPDLNPTWQDLYPKHRHVQNHECPLGSSHTKHCIFADHRPDHCVIPSSPNEQHEHCHSTCHQVDNYAIDQGFESSLLLSPIESTLESFLGIDIQGFDIVDDFSILPNHPPSLDPSDTESPSLESSTSSPQWNSSSPPPPSYAPGGDGGSEEGEEEREEQEVTPFSYYDSNIDIYQVDGSLPDPEVFLQANPLMQNQIWAARRHREEYASPGPPAILF